jgi:signal transduction histidine kinase
LVNLVENALKHSPAGETVTIGLELGSPELQSQYRDMTRIPAETKTRSQGWALVAPENEPAVLLWVEDHGDGIPPEEHVRIFERFYRRGSELRRRTQGVGIGLSIVKHIVEAHGGRVWLRSAPGNGSRFVLELPLSAARPGKTNPLNRSSL